MYPWFSTTVIRKPRAFRMTMKEPRWSVLPLQSPHELCSQYPHSHLAYTQPLDFLQSGRLTISPESNYQSEMRPYEGLVGPGGGLSPKAHTHGCGTLRATGRKTWFSLAGLFSQCGGWLPPTLGNPDRGEGSGIERKERERTWELPSEVSTQKSCDITSNTFFSLAASN